MRIWFLSTTNIHGKIILTPTVSVFWGNGICIELAWIQFAVGFGFMNAPQEIVDAREVD